MDKDWTTPELLLGQIQNLQLSQLLVLKAKKESCDSNFVTMIWNRSKLMSLVNR
jgi:hypothetical protein